MSDAPSPVNSRPASFKPSDYLHPRYWPTWLGIALMRMCAPLPYGLQLFIGRRIGDVMRLLLPSRRRIATINIDISFPERDAAARKRLVAQGFQSAGISLMESALSWWASDAHMRRLYRFEGEEYLQQALQQGKGVLLLGGHYTTLEISGRFLAFHTDALQPIYKPAHNRLFNALMVASRTRLFDDLLINTDFRGIVRSLKHNKAVWYAPDQDFGGKRSVFAPFMGIQTATLTMTMRLAKMSGSPVLPFYSERLPGTQGYLIRLGPPLENFPSNDDVADATAINQVIEVQVRRTPEQYLWLHRRFRSRPPGEKKFYPSRKKRSKPKAAD